ncbi:MAG: HAD-IA family hydrolase [Spongiibacteraceae bacterium]
MNIRLLTFDLDDTLWDLRPVLLRADQLAFEWLSNHAPALGELFSVESFRQARLQIASARPDLGHRVSELRLYAQTEALKQAGYAESEAQRLSAQAFEIFMQARHDIHFFDAALDVLAELRRDYLLGAITNGNASPSRLGLDHLFAFTITSEELSHPKPHAIPFQAALQRARCDARQAIHIGDHVDHDMRGATAAGMFTIWINRAGEMWPGNDLPNADIQHLAQLPDAVRAIEELSEQSR